MTERRHATAIAIGGRVVLLLGPSGSGKSDLALRLIDRGAQLVADDQTLLTAEDGTLIASAVAGSAGLLEVRGVGIVRMATHPPAPVALVVQLGERGPRLPRPRTCEICGVHLPCLRLDAAQVSAPIHVELALNGDIMTID